MALTALLQAARRSRRAVVPVALITLGIVGASLFYGDGVITPAISVLSAVEGLKVAVPSLHSLVLPITVAILCVLFAIQRFGTGVVGNLFGPVMVVWFCVLGVVGAVEVAHHPGILRALSPSYGVQFFADARRRRVHRARLGRAGGDGRRGALRGHGPFRAPADPPRLVLGRVPGAHPQLPRAGRADLALPAGDRRPLLPVVPGLGADPDGGAGDRRDGDRLAGGDLGRLQRDPAGGAARLSAPAYDPPHLRAADRADLRAGDQRRDVRDRARDRRSASARPRRLRRPTASRSPARSSSTRSCSSRSRGCCGASREHRSRSAPRCSSRSRSRSSRRTSRRSCTADGCRSRSRSSSSRS